MEEIVAFFDKIGRPIVGKKVNKNGNNFAIRHGILVCIRPDPNNNGSLQAKPLDLINESPDVRVQQIGIVKDVNVPIDFPFKEDEVAYFEINDQFKTQYLALVTPPAPGEPQIAPQQSAPTSSAEDNIVKLF